MTCTRASATAVIAEPHDALRRLIREILEAAGVSIVGEAGTSKEVQALVERTAPEILVLDFLVPRAVLLARRLKRTCPSTRVVALVETRDEAYERALAGAGVHAYLEKENLADLHTVIGVCPTTREGRPD